MDPDRVSRSGNMPRVGARRDSMVGMSKEMAANNSPQTPRRFRWVWRTLLFVVVFVVGWYVLGRATDGSRRVRVVEHATAQATSPPVLAEGESLTVAAYNIAHARGLADSNWAGERDARLTDIAELIGSWDADVVVLNEVDLDATWSGRTNQARVLAERAGYAYRAEQCNYDLWLPGFRIRFGNAVLSRFPIVNAQPVDYPAVSGWESAAFGRKRGLVCTLDLGTGRRVRIVAVHWDTRNDTVRAGSAEAIAKLANDAGPPLIAAGDFNSSLLDDAASSAEVARLTEPGTLAWADDTPADPAPASFPSASPTRLIDYILAQPPLRVTGFRVVDSQLSDHRPVVAEVVWPDDD